METRLVKSLTLTLMLFNYCVNYFYVILLSLTQLNICSETLSSLSLRRFETFLPLIQDGGGPKIMLLTRPTLNLQTSVSTIESLNFNVLA